MWVNPPDSYTPGGSTWIDLTNAIFSVFWDLYSAAPERRDTHEHSNEAKAFHDYVIICFCNFFLRRRVSLTPDTRMVFLT